MVRYLRIASYSILVISIVAASGYAVYQLLTIQRGSIPDDSTSETSVNAPQLNVSVIGRGFDHPWDVAFLPDQTLLFTERPGTISKLVDGSKVTILRPDNIAVAGEGGMLGLAVDPLFDDNRFIYACYNTNQNDIRVARWTMNSTVNELDNKRDIVTGIPANPSGRHSGCRIDFGPDGNLWVGTGDAARESTPQDLSSLGGKILRVDREGKGVPGNITNGDKRIFSYGHRNTQGLAFFAEPKDGVYGYSAEHGSDRDDEINPLSPGNFGWAPGRGYDEAVPMTDSKRFPDAVSSVWSSGDPTIAIADLAILAGDQWDGWQGRLAVSVLKDRHLRLIQLDGDRVINEQKLLNQSYGRLRASVLGPDGSLYITTDNGNDEDLIIKVSPRHS